MNIHEIRELCIQSADSYYNYLNEKDLGKEEIDVISIKNIEQQLQLWQLTLAGKIFNLDMISIWNIRHQETYSNNDFSVQSYDFESNRLIIKFRDQPTNFKSTSSAELKIISDLKFLVKNVREWYVKNGMKISITTNEYTKTRSNSRNVNFSQFKMLNNDQIEAINNINTNKYSYIWGPPGSGKTRAVLTNSVFEYIQNKEILIGIFAPTNNSLEEVLTTLLENADRLKISRDSFIRLGSPSSKFAARFPEVCEVTGLQKKIEEINSQIQIITNTENFRKGKNTLNSAESLSVNINELKILLQKRDELILKSELLDKELFALRSRANSFGNRLKRLFVARENIDEQHMNNVSLQKDSIDKDIEKIENSITLHFGRIKRIKTGSSRLDQKLSELTYHNIDLVKNNIEHIKDEIIQFLSISRAHAENYKNDSDQHLEELKTQLAQKLIELKSMEVDERIKTCSVIGSTLDTYISRFINKNISFNHIFIDEASYVPLIKALILFNNSSLTLLGDHKQLPPVCEMDEKELDRPQNKSVLLWKKSSLFCECVFNHDKSTLFDSIFKNDAPPFYITKKTDLRITHRFGANLAEILDNLFCKIGFKAECDSNNNVKIYIINAQLQQRTNSRENHAELAAIRKILDKHSFSNFAVLTPYKAQVALLNNSFPELRRSGNVLTIHKSQGREWETVILSVVDSGQTRTPWFTDCQNKISQGSLVLNTAVSRVKKELFIVCDKNYWANRQDKEKQLISNLIKAGSEIILN